MAFSMVNFANPELSKSPLNDIIGNLLSGYTDTTKARYLQPGLEEELRKAKLFNQYYGPDKESQIGLRGAQAGHLGAMTEGLNISNPFLKHKLEQEEQQRQFGLENPFFGQTGVSGDLGRLLSLQQMISKNPELAAHFSSQSQEPEPQSFGQGQSYIPSLQQPKSQDSLGQFDFNSLLKNAFNKVAEGKDKQFAPSNIGKLQQEYAAAQSGINPTTNEPFASKQEQEEFVAPYREKLGGLKTGEHYIYDPESHEKIGLEKPLSAEEKKVEFGRSIFNEVFPDINNAFKDFIGKDSVKNFMKYADQYGKNETATRKIDDLLLGQKLITAGVVNEAATLGAGKTNQTYRSLLKSFPGSDIPALIERYGKEFKLPSDAFVKAGVRFQNKINSATDKAIKAVPATRTSYFHPEKYLKSDEEKSREREDKQKINEEKDFEITPEMARTELERRKKAKGK